MRELINDPFYESIRRYDRCIIDYCLIGDDTPHQGYRSHKDAVLFAPFYFQREQKNWKYMNGRQTGQIILKPAMNGGVLHAGVYTIRV